MVPRWSPEVPDGPQRSPKPITSCGRSPKPITSCGCVADGAWMLCGNSSAAVVAAVTTSSRAFRGRKKLSVFGTSGDHLGPSGDHLGTTIRRSYRFLIIVHRYMSFLATNALSNFRRSFFTRIFRRRPPRTSKKT